MTKIEAQKESSMKERPIIFSSPMVRSIIEGRKTQTRRVMKLQPYANGMPEHWSISELAQFCPYGQPGDLLWVREAWTPGYGKVRQESEGDDENAIAIIYRADRNEVYRPVSADVAEKWGDYSSDGPDDPKWRPSIRMPRWASRITLEVAGVRVERLQDISESDAVAEGVAGGHGAIPGYGYSATPVEHYRWLWEQINGKGAWAANPWVWVIEFRRVAA